MDESPHVLGIPIEIAFALFALLAGVNIVYLDVFIIGLLKKPQEPSQVIVTKTSDTTKDICPASCLTQIQAIAPLQTITPRQTPTPTKRQQTTSTVKEFFIPFGSGSGATTDWADVTGLQASIDTRNYLRIKTVTFEVSLRIPTGNQTTSARLYNITDKHPVWFSDISVEGGTARLVVSEPITLDPGSKTYQVQLKNSLGYPSNIDQARLRIVTY